MKIFLFYLIMSFASSAFAYESVNANQSFCLNTVVYNALEQIPGDLVTVRDTKTGLISDIVNLDTEERFALSYLARVDGTTEFISK